MANLLTQNSNCLRLLMTEDLYILPENEQHISKHTEQSSEIKELKIDKVEILETPELPVQESSQASTEQAMASVITREFRYLGDNNKYFLILIDEHEQSDIKSIHQETLLKIMSAKGMELRDLAILNINLYPGVSFTELKNFFSFNKIVMFGIDPQRLTLPPQSSNQIVKTEGARILCTYNIDEMIVDTHKKREFWSVMKDF